MQLQYDVRAEIVDYVPRILRLPCKQEDDDDYKGNGGGDHDEAGSRPATGVRNWTRPSAQESPGHCAGERRNSTRWPEC